MPNMKNSSALLGAALAVLLTGTLTSRVQAQDMQKKPGTFASLAVWVAPASSRPDPGAVRIPAPSADAGVSREQPARFLFTDAASQRTRIQMARHHYRIRTYQGPNGLRPKHRRRKRPFRWYENARVRSMMRFYLFKRRDLLEEGFRRSGRYLVMIRRIFKQERIPAVLADVAMVESNFDPRAVSPVKALGLWQFTATTGRKFGLRLRHPWYDERQDPIASTYAAARFLGYLYDKYGNWELSLAAYNAGEGRINKARRRARARRRSTNYWSLRLPRQTRRYVPSFLALARIMENAAKYGLNPDHREAPMNQVTLELHLSGTLQELAGRAGIPQAHMARLNPAWHGWAVSGNPEDRIIVNLPPGASSRFMLSLWDSPPAPISWRFHTVKEGESITHLAGLYGVTPEAILKMNGMIPIGMVMVGKRLLIPIPALAIQKVTHRNQSGMKAGRGKG